MNLDKLEKLADAASREYGYAYCNPATIKRLIALVRMQHSVIESTETEMRYAGFSQYESDNVMRKQVYQKAHEALAAYEQFEKGVVR